LKLNQRLKLKQTAAALNCVPSWNLPPRRSLNVHASLFFVTDHERASDGRTTVVPGLSVTSPSII